ncbi:class E sortase [Georgenia yuyongxinii]|uniref:Class E sortase n=1 Tax=Georgenia yuyongxinii TaxID=2589797 RepID=A0A5B8C411_9MICO|nr:class E sortase [Georgenia yuyongxinii]QDC24035.1 class E sortase [Georgenia yuyongxinii]
MTRLTGAAAPPAPRAVTAPVSAHRGASVLGELLITAAAVLALFVVWQVWWTDVTGGRAQVAAVVAIETSFPTVPATPADSPASPLRTDAPPTLAEVPAGTGFAVVHVPRWGTDHALPVLEGVDARAVLDTGAAGHYPGTAPPGAVGNFALAAHRQTYGAAFRRVDELRVGDPIVVETAEAWLVYRVTADRVVAPEEVSVIAPVPGAPGEAATARMITFTTCHPLWSTAQRWVTHGELAGWLPRAAGVPAELGEVA